MFGDVPNHTLLLVWEKIFKQFPQWKLAIAGEGENEYVARLKRKAQEYGLGSSVIWTGFVEKEKKKELFLQSELFILPSFSENFGNVISEALSFGVPVITTQNTPWKILETQKCGWWVKSDEIALEKALKASLAASPEELSQMGQRGRQMVQELYDWAQISSQMSAVYRWALHEGEKPDCVRLS